MRRALLSLFTFPLLFAATPNSTNYTLRNYDYGSGGTGGSTSTNYKLNATTGGSSNTSGTSTNYSVKPGEVNVQQAYVPAAPTFTNPASYYDKLKVVINPGANPTDTKFSIAISSDGFVTTQYVQTDDTVGATLPIAAYQTYATWGGASGFLIIGLSPSTTYQIKVNAIQGNFTQTQYGPTASAATVAPAITFDIDTSPIDTSTSPPYTASFGSLLPATVTSANNKVWVSLDTNGDAGGNIYIASLNGGLKSAAFGTTITSATANLAAASTGYGAQGSSATQTSGGPFTIVSPYNVSAQNVGALSTTLKPIFTTTAPITAGRASLILMAKVASTTTAASDYQDILTITAAASF